jgi:hypothetical protein
VYIVPNTSLQIFPSVAVIAVPAIGLVPISPKIAYGETSEIPDSDRITKLPADPRATGAGPAAIPGAGLESSASSAAVRTKLLDVLDVFDMMFFSFDVCLFTAAFPFWKSITFLYGVTIGEAASTVYGVLPYLSTQFKEWRNLPKDHAPLKAKARNRW